MLSTGAIFSHVFTGAAGQNPHRWSPRLWTFDYISHRICWAFFSPVLEKSGLLMYNSHRVILSLLRCIICEFWQHRVHNHHIIKIHHISITQIHFLDSAIPQMAPGKHWSRISNLSLHFLLSWNVIKMITYSLYGFSSLPRIPRTSLFGLVALSLILLSYLQCLSAVCSSGLNIEVQ